MFHHKISEEAVGDGDTDGMVDDSAPHQANHSPVIIGGLATHDTTVRIQDGFVCQGNGHLCSNTE